MSAAAAPSASASQYQAIFSKMCNAAPKIFGPILQIPAANANEETQLAFAKSVIRLMSLSYVDPGFNKVDLLSRFREQFCEEPTYADIVAKVQAEDLQDKMIATAAKKEARTKK